MIADGRAFRSERFIRATMQIGIGFDAAIAGRRSKLTTCPPDSIDLVCHGDHTSGLIGNTDVAVANPGICTACYTGEYPTQWVDVEEILPATTAAS